MNTQNIKTAATETPKTWGKGPEIKGISPALAENLMYLRTLREGRMLTRERDEQLFGTLTIMADAVCSTVTDWSTARPVMPLSSVQAWAEAREIALTLHGESGKAAWNYAVDYLRTELSVGYAMFRADIA
ncbi:hypothetical protein [Erwinia sp. JH02]|uniref:hypothetical protein n=1 Tax=Erwinia sp. JH02 TaxID=2733394 RepID=UPI0014878849|nr:hypothetical protein [Erwinia sp. JH02]NNS09998.1 hypothetical protein [Erwinia sp. JH02]